MSNKYTLYNWERGINCARTPHESCVPVDNGSVKYNKNDSV